MEKASGFIKYLRETIFRLPIFYGSNIKLSYQIISIILNNIISKLYRKNGVNLV